MNYLETERLILRNITSDDANDIFEYSQNPNVGLNAGWKPHETILETRQIMNTIFIGQPNIFGIVLKSNMRVIGSIGLIPDPKRSNPDIKMLGYALGEPYWGNGYMTECVKMIIEYGFDMLNLSHISAYTYPHNTRSQNILKKCGFILEGTLTQSEKLFNGEIYDERCYILSK